MLRSYSELKSWWNGLPKSDREILFDKMLEKSMAVEFSALVKSIRQQYRTGKELSQKQLQLLNNWS